MATKFLESGQTTSEVFYPNGSFTVQITGLSSNPQDWYIEQLPRQLPNSSSEWTEVTLQPFADSVGRRSLTFAGSEGFKYRLRNTSGSPTNSGIEAYWHSARTEIFR